MEFVNNSLVTGMRPKLNRHKGLAWPPFCFFMLYEKLTLTKFWYVSKICNHTKFKDPKYMLVVALM
jgi:hypothetical protein